MAAPDNFSEAAALGRSSSMDARDNLSRSDSQRKTKGGAKKGHRSGNELFVCFAPRTSLNLSSRPVLSPSREKGQKEHPSSRKALSSSIFSKASAKKQGFPAEEDAGEEPTSPKVTCIGQVRVKHKKSKEAAPLYKGGKQPQRSLGQEGKHKESACSSFGKDFSCFGLPCDSYGSLPSFRGDKKSGGAVFAKSLVLIQQETEEKAEPKGASIKQQPQPHVAAVHVTHPAERVPKEQEQSNQAAVMPTIDNTVGEVQSKSLVKKHDDPLSETEVEEDDTFDADPPPPNALLLMRSKAETLHVSVTPPALNITLKRSTSAPVQSRSKEEEDGKYCEEEVVWQVEQQEHDLCKSNHDSQKSFFKRCKSVSQSFTRSNSTEAPAHIVEKRLDKIVEENKEPPAQEAVRASNIKEDEDTHDAEAILEMVNVGRSESESLKVSLDFVPETWLWEHCPIARPPKSEKRLVDNKQGIEWLDAELEASLWKCCKVSDPHRPKEQSVQSVCSDGNTAAQNTAGVDAEVEATLWRSCGLFTSVQSDSQNGSCNAPCEEGLMMPSNGGVAEDEAVENKRSISSLGRSFSVGNHSGRQLERGDSLCRSCSVGSQSGRIGQEGDQVETKERGLSKMDPDPKGGASKIQVAMLKQGKDLAVTGIVQNGGKYKHSGDDCLCDDREEVQGKRISMEEGTNACDQGATQLVQAVQGGPGLGAVEGDPSSDPKEQPPAPAPSPSPGPETLVFVRYNLGAFHISLDAPDNILNTIEHKAGDKACMLQAVSHLSEVSYARLLKASSGKEPVSLSPSAFQLPRCKSEPVRLTSH